MAVAATETIANKKFKRQNVSIKMTSSVGSCYITCFMGKYYVGQKNNENSLDWTTYGIIDPWGHIVIQFSEAETAIDYLHSDDEFMSAIAAIRYRKLAKICTKVRTIFINQLNLNDNGNK